MQERIDLIQALHASTKRDYIKRVVEHDKAECAEIARRFDREYWDGERHLGYGGYRYDGRWNPIAQRMVERYAIQASDRILDVGCGKGYLLYEFMQIVPGVGIAGLDVSAYAIQHAKPEVRSDLIVGSAESLPYRDGEFDVVVSLGTLHNLNLPELWSAISEIERVGTGSRKYIMVESYRNEREKANLLYWQLTCRSFFSVEDWEWIFRKAGYTGDFGFIFFE